MCKAIVIHFLINTYFCENTLGQIVVGVDVQVAVGARVLVVDVEAARDAVAVLYACAGFVEYDDVLEGVVADGEGGACGFGHFEGCVEARIRLYVLRGAVFYVHHSAPEAHFVVFCTRCEQCGEQEAKKDAVLH